jgi:DNA-binding CsgD family transcriptional regulator
MNQSVKLKDLQKSVGHLQKDNDIVAMFSALASICRGSVYVIDFKQKCFQYVGNHDLFLCGYSVNEVMQWGYDFYPEIVHPEDMPLLKKIFNGILTAGSDIDKQNDIHYFSFTIRIRMYPQKREKPDYLMTYHKLVPVFADGQIQFGVCLVTCSETERVIDEADEADEADKYSNNGSGNLNLYYKDNEDFDKYSLISSRWKTYKIKHLTKYEKIILILAMSGESNKSIAEELRTSSDNLQHILTRLYRKLRVKNMTQAIIHSINHSLIFCHSDKCDVPKQKNKENNKIKEQKNKRRIKITPEVWQRIRTGLDNKKSIRSIAKEENVSEAAIRKTIKSKK